MDLTGLLATTISNNAPMIYLVALGAVIVALALSFIARFAFYILGILGTVGAAYVVYMDYTGPGLSTSTAIFAGALLLGGWIVGFVVRGTIKIGSVLTVAFATLLIYLTVWADNAVSPPANRAWDSFAWYYFAIAGIVVAAVVLWIPSLLGKAAKGAVHVITPGGHPKEKEAPKEMEARR
ncbi:MAG: hypothetical protein ACYDDF_00010 [Thermoplasmatota archaeon]